MSNLLMLAWYCEGSSDHERAEAHLLLVEDDGCDWGSFLCDYPIQVNPIGRRHPHLENDCLEVMIFVGFAVQDEQLLSATTQDLLKEAVKTGVLEL